MLSTFCTYKTKAFVFLALKALIFSPFSARAFDSPASSFNFYNQKLENLNSFKRLNTSDFKGQKSIWVSFEANCVSCKKQLNDLRCIPNEVRLIALGVKGSRKSLVKALQPVIQDNLLKLKISKKIRNLLKISLTPTTYVVNNDGEIMKTIKGGVSCMELKKALDLIDKQV